MREKKREKSFDLYVWTFGVHGGVTARTHRVTL